MYTDRAAMDFGKKIFMLQPLLPDGFTPDFLTRRPTKRETGLDKHTEIADTNPAQSGSFTNDSPSTQSERQPPQSAAQPEQQKSFRDGWPSGCVQFPPAGHPIIANGVGGSNPPTPIRLELTSILVRLTESNFAIIGLVQRLMESQDVERTHSSTNGT